MVLYPVRMSSSNSRTNTAPREFALVQDGMAACLIPSIARVERAQWAAAMSRPFTRNMKRHGACHYHKKHSAIATRQRPMSRWTVLGAAMLAAAAKQVAIALERRTLL